MLFAKFLRGQCRYVGIFEGGGILACEPVVGVLGVYYLLKNIITGNLKGGKTAVKGGS